MDGPRAGSAGEVPGDEDHAQGGEGEGAEQGDAGHERGEDEVGAEGDQGQPDPQPQASGFGLADPPGDGADRRPGRWRAAAGCPRSGRAGPARARSRRPLSAWCPAPAVVEDLADEGRSVASAPWRPGRRCLVLEARRVCPGLERGEAARDLVVGGRLRRGTGHPGSLPRSTDGVRPGSWRAVADATCREGGPGTSPSAGPAARRSPAPAARPPGRRPGRCSRPGRPLPGRTASRG